MEEDENIPKKSRRQSKNRLISFMKSLFSFLYFLIILLALNKFFLRRNPNNTGILAFMRNIGAFFMSIIFPFFYLFYVYVLASKP